MIAGLSDLREQIRSEDSIVARSVRAELAELRARDAFVDAVPAHFEGDDVGQARADDVLDWLATLLPAGG